MVAVDNHRRIGLVGAEEAVDGLAHRRHLRGFELALGVHGGIAGGQQHRVALTQRNLELLSQPDHHLPAGTCAPGLQETDLAGRDLGLQRQLELAEVPPLAPRAEQLSNGGGATGDGHTAKVSLARLEAITCQVRPGGVA